MTRNISIDAIEFPKLIVFDIDYTLWPLWIDTHITPPLKASPNVNTVLDSYDESISFYPDVPAILHSLQESKVLIAAASRTTTPDLARQALKLLKVPPTGNAAETFFDHVVIYPGTKLRHFRELEKTTGIKHVDMLFFDDEYRNREVEKLGVTFILIGRDGVTKSVFERGVEEWRRRRNTKTQKDS